MASEDARGPASGDTDNNSIRPIHNEEIKPPTTVDELRVEIERLKSRLEEERRKLNDVSCK